MASPKLLRERSILICFSTRQGGTSPAPYDTLNLALHVGDQTARVIENRRRFGDRLSLDARGFTTARQVHGSNIELVGEDRAGAGALSADNAIPNADGLMTDIPGIPLLIFTADCVPVILADIKTRKISVVHAGWQGIYSLIVPKAVSALKDAVPGLRNEIVAFIGPAVGRCCYAVDEDRAAKFDKVYIDRRAGQPRLNLKAVVRDQLIGAGLAGDNITDSGLCTCCRKDLFFSFRRDGVCGRQAAIAAVM